MKPCLLCGRKRAIKLFQKKNFFIYKCVCGLVFTSRPSEKRLKEMYKKDDYFRFWGEQDEENLLRVEKMKKKTFASFLLPLKSPLTLPLGQPLKKPRFLDIGCATGGLLEVAQDFGWETFGIEPVKEFARRAQKKFPDRIFQGFFEDYNQKKAFFDLVVMFDVLEHLGDPQAALEKANRLLKSGGILAISTPNLESYSGRLMSSFWPHFKEEHLFYFKPKTIKKLLTKTGFEVKEIRPTKKYLNLSYFSSYWQAFHLPGATRAAKFLLKILPERMLNFTFFVPTGSMDVVAEKK